MGLSQKDQTKHNTLLRLGKQVGKNGPHSSYIWVTPLIGTTKGHTLHIAKKVVFIRHQFLIFRGYVRQFGTKTIRTNPIGQLPTHASIFFSHCTTKNTTFPHKSLRAKAPENSCHFGSPEKKS